MEPKKKIKRFEGLDLSEGVRYKMGRGLTPTMFTTPSGVERPQYRYIMEVPTPGGVTECLVNCEKPRLEIRSGYGRDHWVVSHSEWTPIRVIIRDVIGPRQNEVYRFFMDWAQSVNQQDIRTYKRNITLKMMDPTGLIVELWHLHGSFPTNITLNDFTHENHSEMEITLNYDFCNFSY
jgi:hypothetical protein